MCSAKQLSQAQRRALGIRRNPDGWYPAPSASTFSRLLSSADLGAVDQAVRGFQAQVRGPPPRDELIVLDGKQPKHAGGHAFLTAETVPSQHYLGCGIVAKQDKTNEIPVARRPFSQLDLEGQLVRLDALHTQTETARDLVQEHGADYLLTVKDNQRGRHKTIQKLLPDTPAAFPPEDSTPTRACAQERNRSRQETRTLLSAPTTPETVRFPAAAQVARVHRIVTGRQPETVALVTSASPQRLDARAWLQLNRAGSGGIENGLHQRLDVPHDDDRCRVRHPNSIGVLRILRRQANSLFMECRSRQTNSRYLTTTDFAADMAAQGHRRAVMMATAMNPTFTGAP